MQLDDFLQQYLRENDLSADYHCQLTYTLRQFQAWAGRPLALDDLTDDLVNRYLIHLAESRRPATIKSQRGNLLTLWRSAWHAHLCETQPLRVRKIKVPRTLPEAWQAEQMVALLSTAATMRGRFRYWRIERAAFWRAFILTAWDSGLRLGDILKIGREQIGSDGSLVLSQSKTMWPILCQLRPETVAAIDATFPPARDQIFGSVLCKRQVIAYFRAIAKRAGLVGGTKKVRRSAASHVEAQQPGAATPFLGHRSPGLAARHYIDPRISGRQRPLPPPLAG